VHWYPIRKRLATALAAVHIEIGDCLFGVAEVVLLLSRSYKMRGSSGSGVLVLVMCTCQTGGCE
jgi:hypothetical protein